MSLQAETRTHVIGVATLAKRALMTVVVPQRVFRQIDPQDSPSIPGLILIFFLWCVFDVTLNCYLIFHWWMWQIYPFEWKLLAVGVSCHSFNQWLLTVQALVVLNALRGSPITTPGPFLLMSYYLCAGRGIITAVLDVGQFFFRIPTQNFHVPLLMWLEQHSYRPSVLPWAVIFPWTIMALWMALRYRLRYTGLGWSFLAAVMAVVLPISGQLLFYNSPINLLYLLCLRMGWRLIGIGSAACLANGLITIGAALLLWRTIPHPHTISAA